MPRRTCSPAGDVVFMSSYALGRSADIWEDPEEFRPVRSRSDMPSVCGHVMDTYGACVAVLTCVEPMPASCKC